jgi:hypothetical protein
MSVQVPPNSSGSVIETWVSATKVLNLGERQITSLDSGGRPTYSAGYTAQSVGTAATTDLFYISGSAAATVRVLQCVINATIATAGQEFDLTFQKESTLPTGGTKATAATIVPWDSLDAAAGATTAFYTATPTAGTLVGVMLVTKFSAFIATATTVQPPTIPYVFNFGSGLPGAKAITLRGAVQDLATTINAATPGNASSWDVSWIWTETPGD